MVPEDTHIKSYFSKISLVLDFKFLLKLITASVVCILHLHIFSGLVYAGARSSAEKNYVKTTEAVIKIKFFNKLVYF